MRNKEPNLSSGNIDPENLKTASEPLVPPSGHPPYRHPVYANPYYGQPVGHQEGGMFGDLTPLRLLRVARRKWLTIFLAVAFALLAAWMYLRITPKIYRASSLIEMSVRRPRIMRHDGAIVEDRWGYTAAQEIFNTRLERFRGSAMRTLAFEHLDRTGPGADRLPDRVEAMPGASFSMARESHLVNITVLNRDPLVAAAVANAYALAAGVSMETENREVSEMAVAWLRDQARAQRLAIEETDRELVEFREKVQLDSLETRVRLASENTHSAGRTLADIQNRKLLQQELLTAIDAAELTPESIEQLPGDTPFFVNIVAAIERFASVRAERDALRSRLTSMHPEYIAADNAVNVARDRVASALRQARETVQADVRLLDQQAAEMERRVAQLDAASSALDIELAQASASYAALQRQREASDMSYRGLLTRIEEARLSADEYTAAVKLVRLAQPPSGPVHPSRRRAVSMALFFGLALGGLLALIKDEFEDLLAHDDDLERKFGVDILSIVPRIKDRQRTKVAKKCHQDKHSYFAEAFARLRGTFDSEQCAGHAGVLLVTSTMPEVGKTICSTNLAISFAQRRGQRTLLIDFDMRRPQLQQIFEMPSKHPSLLHVLSKRDPRQFDTLPFVTDIEGLDVISSRPSRELSVSEVLGQTIIGDFIGWAREKYDRVILDSPPYGVVSDVIVLSRLVDGIVMVLRPGISRIRPARNAIKRFSDIGLPLSGIIMNALDFRTARLSAGYDYQYSHVSAERYGITVDGE